jgi:AraC-like DNA-binding protein
MSFAHTPSGIQHIAASAHHARHRHAAAYAALVLRGSYEEAGSHGRFALREGDVIFHGAFEAHADRFAPRDAQILNLPLPQHWDGSMAGARCADPGAVLRRFHGDPCEAAALLIESTASAAPAARDWPDLLLADLRADTALSLSDWAARHDLSRETLSRGLARIYGVSPAALRRELRAQKAWARTVSSSSGLAAIAAEAGFADQAHMTREVRALTGRTPGQWRRA